MKRPAEPTDDGMANKKSAITVEGDRPFLRSLAEKATGWWQALTKFLGRPNDDNEMLCEVILPLMGVRSCLLSYLDLQSRSRLRQCSVECFRYIECFERNLANSSNVEEGCKGAREELMRKTQNRRWLPWKLSTEGESATEEPEMVPGPSNLRRVIRGEFLEVPSYDDYTPGRKREIPFYNKEKLIDGHLWVLYSDYRDQFEVFDLDTGKAIDFGPDSGGPDRYYYNGASERIRLLLGDYNGHYGLLAADLSLACMPSSNPHGIWSGPYLSVWELLPSPSRSNVRMQIDLRRPTASVQAVSVVSPSKCVVLLRQKNGALLQWHRIPTDCNEFSGSPPPPPKPEIPGPKPPPHRCSMNCDFLDCEKAEALRTWTANKAAWEKEQRTLRAEEKDDAVPEYRWWPVASTLLQENVLQQDPTIALPWGQTAMHSDGRGIMVTVVRNAIQFWHVGTMSLVRTCQPFEGIELAHELGDQLQYSNLVSTTNVSPVKDIPPGEGYEAQFMREQHATSSNGSSQGEISNITRNEAGSAHHLDLAQCDTDSILARFGQTTVGQQRDFENGICGISNGTLIRRARKLPPGTCSPQLECMVRVVFLLRDEETNMKLVVLDVNVFHHICNFYSMKMEDGYDYDDDEEYTSACLGTGGLWSSDITRYRPSGGTSETVMVVDWNRGGSFDFPGHGPGEGVRLDNLFRKYESLVVGKSIDESDQVLRQTQEMNSRWMESRFPRTIHVDAHKIIVATTYEISIWPLALNSPEQCEDEPVPESWIGGITSVDKELQPWYSVRPLDAGLLQHMTKRFQWKWNLDNEEQVSIDFLLRAFDESSFQEGEELLNAARFSGIGLSASISWRHLALSISTAGDDDAEELHLFDVLGDWARSVHQQFQSERREPAVLNTRFDPPCISREQGVYIPAEDDEYRGEEDSWGENSSFGSSSSE